jgi:hypothetical protein
MKTNKEEMKADRKADQKMMEEDQARAEANMERQISFLASKMDINQARK